MSSPNDERRDRGPGIIAAAIVAAALILSWGNSRSDQRYQIASSGDGVVRMDTDSGEMIACNVQRCSRIQPPDRAKTFGPLTIEVGDDAEKKAPPAPPKTP
ncbi:MAG TPA: hypothetical protein VL336_06140 [Sphingomicrobium sp.]|jgi:hypothetical protein|nr:hypothetical protein [Sphingomicrobium sp.]